MAKLNELDLGQDPIAGEDDLGNLPEQFGGQFPDPPQPGSYRVQFPPAAALMDAWDTQDKKVDGNVVGKRIVCKHQGDAALTIVQSPGNRMNGEPFETRISNNERPRGKKDDPTTKSASDMDYVLAVTKYPGKKPKTNQEYAQAYSQHVPGKTMGVDIEFQWSCNPEKPIRIDDPNNGLLVLDGQDNRQLQKGCGNRYYQKDIDKVFNEKTQAQEYPVRITCQCGAQLRAFAQIARFRE